MAGLRYIQMEGQLDPGQGLGKAQDLFDQRHLLRAPPTLSPKETVTTPVDPEGFEPSTLGLRDPCSTKLSYKSVLPGVFTVFTWQTQGPVYHVWLSTVEGSRGRPPTSDLQPSENACGLHLLSQQDDCRMAGLHYPLLSQGPQASFSTNNGLSFETHGASRIRT